MCQHGDRGRRTQVFDILEKNVFYGMTGKFGPETDEQALDLRSDILKKKSGKTAWKKSIILPASERVFSLVRRQLERAI